MARFIGSLVLLVSLAVGTNAFADFKVYGENNQYYGILFDKYDAGTASAYLLYNEQLDAFVRLQNFDCCSIWDSYNTYGHTVYETSDCSGTPYTFIDSTFKSLYRYIVRGFNGKNYVVSNGTPTVSRFIRSQSSNGSTCTSLTNPSTYNDIFPLENLISLPFSVPANSFIIKGDSSSTSTKTVVIPLFN